MRENVSGGGVPNSQQQQRMRNKEQTWLKPRGRVLAEVIEVSSDEEPSSSHTAGGDRTQPATDPSRLKLQLHTSIAATPTPRRVRYIQPHKVVSISSSDSEDEPSTPAAVEPEEPLLYSPVKVSHAREVIDLTADGSDDDEAQDTRELLFNTESLPHKKGAKPAVQQKPGSRSGIRRQLFPSSITDQPDTEEPGYLGSDSGLMLHVPPSRSRFVARPRVEHSKEQKDAMPSTQTIPLYSENSDGEDSEVTTALRSGSPSRSVPKPSASKRVAQMTSSHPGSGDEPMTPKRTEASESKSNAKTPRMTKKAKQAMEQTRRERYAQELFEEINDTVFKCGLPRETVLKWSNRLLTTAGRARWKRSRDGSQTSEIELATKILDCDERIRNTLSHEMCHLACWIIDGDPKEGHGKAFKSWASKIMRRRPDIEVTTRHNYEINYPYEWECENCAKIYGRYSKSIRPEECRCGTCKVGKLVPLFKVRVMQTPKKVKAVATGSHDSSGVEAITDLITDLTLVESAQMAVPRRKQTKSTDDESPVDESAKRINAQLAALTRELGDMAVLC
ncbi:hypothetical protein BDW22DRAFT_1355345 [Trametopsis cervina]|nr:hypothetical protein BDW22DRAFT_1355345 [Trametopsis cervina]